MLFQIAIHQHINTVKIGIRCLECFSFSPLMLLYLLLMLPTKKEKKKRTRDVERKRTLYAVRQLVWYGDMQKDIYRKSIQQILPFTISYLHMQKDM